jgi:choline dehydrogenase-like flavoprotein
MYNITSLPISGLNNNTYGVAAGAIVGGGSAVNGMFFDRGSAADYDAWESLGNPGWSFANLLPYFKKSVTFTPPSPDVAAKYNYTWDKASAYGVDSKGPIQVSYPPFAFPGMSTVWNAWKEFGIPKQVEGAGGKAYNVFSAPSALDPVKRTRSYARTAHYDPYVKRKNLKLVTGYQVTEVKFGKGLKAVGVNVVKKGGNGAKVVVQAKREIVLAAGAIWTPWLLQRSGIGPRSVLEAAGIEVLKDMPGVGANFQDHPFGGAIYQATNPVFPNQEALGTNATFYAEALKEYEAKRTGPLTVARGNQAGFLPLSTLDPDWKTVLAELLKQNASTYLPATYDNKLKAGYAAQLKLTASLLARKDVAAVEFPFGAGPIGFAALQHPLSRGTVSINVTDPGNVPVVDYRTFSNPIDVKFAVATIGFARRFNKTPALASFAPLEVLPGVNITASADIEAYVRTIFGPSFAHPCGTASMLPEKFGGVVDPNLKVWGTSALSVVDASVIPFVPATHLCTTVYAVAERAADLIKARDV